jgi:hypothetical protein
MSMAYTSSGEAATEQMARAQAMRLALKGATITAVDCEEKDVFFHHDSAALLTGVSETNHSLCGANQNSKLPLWHS